MKGGDKYIYGKDITGSLMEMSVRVPRVYFPYLCEENCRAVSRKIKKDFDPIFKLTSAIGITFLETDEIEDTKVKKFSLKKMYDTTVNIMAVIALIITVSFAHNFALSNAMMLTYSIKYTGALLIRLNLLTQRSKFPVLFESLSELYTEVSSCAFKSLKISICLQCIGVLIFAFCVIAIGHLSVFYETRIQDLTQLSFSGFNVTNDGAFSIVHFVFTSYSLNAILSVFTVSAIVLTCLNIHIILRRIIKSYSESLVENLQKDLTKEALTKEVVTFRRIICGINQADDALSFCTFFAYVTCISCFFYTVSLFLQSKNLSKRPFFAAELVSILMLAVFIFMAITVSASKVSDAVEDFKKRVNWMSEIVMKNNLSCDVLLNFMILIDNIKSTNVGMTGWGMFNITRGFVLTTVGVMISYGMVLFQFG